MNCSIRVFWLEFMLNFSKFRLFFAKSGTKFAFYPTCIRFAGRRHLQFAARFFFSSKRARYALPEFESLLEL